LQHTRDFPDVGLLEALVDNAPGNRRDGGDPESTLVLLTQARSGNDAAVDRLVRRFLPDLTRWAHGRLPWSCRPLEDTQTLVLDTFRSAIAHLSAFEYRREGAFMAYLRTIFMNKLRDSYRRADVRPRNVSLTPQLPGREDTSRKIENEEFWRLYNSALDNLPERVREAVFLRLELEWDYERIAEAVGCRSPNAARMYVTRGIRRLAKEMAHVGL
jgi:RNA polymerase sigma-70 factor (ECF subfamily)